MLGYYSLVELQLIYGGIKSHFFNGCDTAKIFADAETALQENFNLTSTGDLEDELCEDLLLPKTLLCFAF